MKPLLVCLLALGAVNLLFAIFQALVFRVADFHVEQIGLGIPPVFRRRVNGIEFKVGLLPVLAYVQAPAWLKASRGTRAVVALVPWLLIASSPFCSLVPRARSGICC